MLTQCSNECWIAALSIRNKVDMLAGLEGELEWAMLFGTLTNNKLQKLPNPKLCTQLP